MGISSTSLPCTPYLQGALHFIVALGKRCLTNKKRCGCCCGCGNCCGGFGCPQCCGCGCGCGCANIVFPVCFGAQCKCPKEKKGKEKPCKECKFTCCWPCCCTCNMPKFKFKPLKAKPCCCCPQGTKRGGS